MIAANSVTVNLLLVLGLFFFFEICEDFDNEIDIFCKLQNSCLKTERKQDSLQIAEVITFMQDESLAEYYLAVNRMVI